LALGGISGMTPACHVRRTGVLTGRAGRDGGGIIVLGTEVDDRIANRLRDGERARWARGHDG